MGDAHPAPLRRPHPGSHPRRPGNRGHPRRRAAARAGQLREPRLPGVARGRRPAGGRQVLPAAALERRRDRRGARVRAGARRARGPRRRAAGARRPHAAPACDVPLRRLPSARRPLARARPARRAGADRPLSRPAARRRQRLAASPRDRRSTSRASATSRARSSSTAASCRPTSSTRTPRSARRRSTRCGAPSTAPARWRSLRLHGDCHAGNVLWTDDGPHFVDLDDARMGPAVQDLWMLLSGDADAQTTQLATCSRATSSSATSTAASCC